MTQHASLNSALNVTGWVVEAIMVLIIATVLLVVAHDVIGWLRWKYLCLKVTLRSNPVRRAPMGQATAG